MAFVTRFAPSPTGPLHLGHAYSALLAHDMARAAGGTFLLRIEDIDQTRCRPEWEAQLIDDLQWLGVRWDSPPLQQSRRLPTYQTALDSLWARGLLYPCTCTRRDIDAALGAPQDESPQFLGPDGVIYPGTCRTSSPGKSSPKDQHLRLNMAATLGEIAGPPTFTETGAAHQGIIATPRTDYDSLIGDVILARKDFATSYHLSVVLDDAFQNITHVIRGEDLFEATRLHALLQHLLGLPTPTYHHHPLIRDTAGKRLAKRDDARALSKYRAEGATPAIIRHMVGL